MRIATDSTCPAVPSRPGEAQVGDHRRRLGRGGGVAALRDELEEGRGERRDSDATTNGPPSEHASPSRFQQLEL